MVNTDNLDTDGVADKVIEMIKLRENYNKLYMSF